MGKSTVKFSGQKEISNNLTKLIKIAGYTNTQCLDELGQRSVAILKLNTPVDSGRLRNSMGYTTNGKVVGKPEKAEDQIGATSDKNSVEAGTNVVYAPSVEYLATNGSQGFFHRSAKQIQPMAKAVIEKYMKRGLKL